MSTTKLLPLEKFQAIDMPLHAPIAQGWTVDWANSGIIPTKAVDKAAQLRHLTRFGSTKPGVQCFFSALFEQGHKLLVKVGRRCAAPRWLRFISETLPLKRPVFYPHLFAMAFQASRYCWDGEKVKDCIGHRGRFTEATRNMWGKDSLESQVLPAPILCVGKSLT